MAYLDFKRYVWMVDTLNRLDGATFQDLDEIWQDEPELNPSGEALKQRTFYNHISAIKEVFGITIQRSAKDGKYRVVIGSDAYSGRMQKALMSTLSLKNTIDRYKDLDGRILYEEEPYANPVWMQLIVHAMQHGKKLSLTYKKLGDKHPTFRTVEPYCLKMNKRRWYLLAREGKQLKTFALDNRTQSITETSFDFEYPKDFNPEQYFSTALGIQVGQGKKVVIKAFDKEADYWRSAPIHPSQKEIVTEKDFALFSLSITTDSWEFIQELLSRGNRIEVLEPKSLRKLMAEQIKEMQQRYAEFWQ